jgi:RNA polymerase sigma-70 factor (ECF subfamily)
MTSAMTTPPSEVFTVPSLVDHLFRRQAGQIVSTLTRILGAEHLDLAEDVVQEALLRALRRWPFEGIPERPAAWLQRVARNGALDRLRRDGRLRALAPHAAAVLHALPEPPLASGTEVADPASRAPDEPAVFVDDQLRMMFMCAHSSLSPDGRVTLMLRTVGGLGVNEIARAFLTEPAAVAQRIVRAKRRLKEGGARLEMPDEADLASRLEAVLEVLSLVFNEGHLAHGGEVLVRESLCADALRLARLLVRHPATARPEVHALCATFCFAAARLPARVTAAGELVTLEKQDRSSWLPGLLAGGFRHLAEAAGGPNLTRYHLQAEIESCHAAAHHANDTDWPRIVRAYDALSRIAPSPVVAVNRAVAVGRAGGAREGWRALEQISNNKALAGYYPYHAARADALRRLGRAGEAADSLRRALSLDPVEPVRRFLARRLASIERA